MLNDVIEVVGPAGFFLSGKGIYRSCQKFTFTFGPLDDWKWCHSLEFLSVLATAFFFSNGIYEFRSVFPVAGQTGQHKRGQIKDNNKHKEIFHFLCFYGVWINKKINNLLFLMQRSSHWFLVPVPAQYELPLQGRFKKKKKEINFEKEMTMIRP